MSQNDLLDLETRLQSVFVAAARLEEELALQADAIRRLSGLAEIPPSGISDAGLVLDPAQLEPPQIEGFTLEVLPRNRRLQLATRAIEAEELALSNLSAERPLIPEIGLQLELSVNTSRVPLFGPDWYGQSDWQATGGVGISSQLYDGGRSQAAVGGQEARAARARLRADEARFELQSALSRGILRMRSLLNRMEIQRRRIERTEEQTEIVANRVRNGAANEQELLQQRLDLLGYRAELVELETDYVQEYYSVQALGPADPPAR